MFKKLLASTAVVALMAGGALAQGTPTEPLQDTQTQERMQAPQTEGQSLEGNLETNLETQAFEAPEAQLGETSLRATDLLASELIGETVYTSTADDAEAVATIDDVVMHENGMIRGVVLTAGGFFGIGGSNYFVPMDHIEVTQNPEGGFWLITDLQPDALDNIETFAKERPGDDAGWQDLSQDSGQGQLQTSDSQAYTPERPAGAESAETPMQAQPAQPDASAQADAVLADDLIGSDIVGVDDESIGSVSDLVLDHEGKFEAMIVDVGGFLGIGSKSVAVAYDEMNIRQDEQGNLVVYTQLTRERLEQAAEFDEEIYRQSPDVIVVDPNL